MPITNGYGAYVVNYLVTSVGGPDAAYHPRVFSGFNPFRYMSPSPTNNNPNSYDLWIQLVIGGEILPGLQLEHGGDPQQPVALTP